MATRKFRDIHVPVEILFLGVLVGLDRKSELGERVRHDFQRHVSAGQVRGQLPGEKVCIGAGDVHVEVRFEQQTVENLLEADALLNFVDVDVMGFVVNDAADDALVEPLSALGLLVSDVVQVEADDMILRNTLSAQRFPVQMEKRRLSRAPRSHDDLDEMRLTQTLQAIEVARAWDEMRRSVHGEILFLF